MFRRFAVLAACVWVAAPARADLSSVSATGFVSSFQREVKATPSQAFEALGRIDQWWNASHTYSGQAGNLRLGLRAGDCFCEQWDGGSVEHARVIYVQRDSTVRLEGGLGPLQNLAVKGVLTFSTGSKDGSTFLRLAYRVSGGTEAGLEKLAPLVDKVMGEQFARWAGHVDNGKP